MKRLYPILFCIAVVCLLACKTKQKKEPQEKVIQITDMAGRSINVPAHITSVFGADLTTTFMLQALAPEMLAAWNVNPPSSEKDFLTKEMKKLPELGMIFYGRSTVNIEDLARLKPDIILCPLFQHTTPAYISDYEEYGKKTGAAVVMVALDFERLPEAFRFLGNLLGKEPKANKLAEYCRETLDWAALFRSQIRDTVSVYVAEGLSGLQTIPAGSTHSQIFDIAGVRNCAIIDEDFGYKDISINIEQVLTWNPDYIIVNSRRANQTGNNVVLSKIREDKSWQMLGAVKNNHILVVPTSPKNWIGRPPGINRLLGIRWLVASIYPEIVQIDIQKEVSRFCNLFYHVSPSPEQINKILNEN